MDKAYSPAAIESRIYARWESLGAFKPAGVGPAYSIVIPPPNVTGTLHMGHAFQNTIMDALIRHRRMQGFDTLWQPGTDHAGIATQMVVERQLNAQGSSRVELGRDAFVERVWQWKRQSGDTISNQMRRLGASVDWSRERFTMDPELSRTVTEVFVRLYREGLIYRGKRLVNWDPVLKTALSDLEVVAEAENGSLWHLRYPFADGPGHVVVATTRPETMFGDAAVAVHPDDERYRALIGRRLRLPLTGRDIALIADTFVDPTFGSGCVKITPAHDFNDYEIGVRHGLPLLNVMTTDARLTDEVPAPYRGLDRFDARARIVADLEAQGLVERIEPHQPMVPRGDRSHAILEPLLTDQWFVRIAPLAQPAVRAVEDGRIRFVPEHWSGVYFEWMRNIKDWCISRQLWWGHRIPAWYDPHGGVHVGRDEDEARASGGIDPGVALRRDEDVLDTWFSSALWPFSTQGWPEPTREMAVYYPTSALITGFDIIFFWVARMIMMGLKFTGAVPFREVYVHGLIRDHDGQKMSKSKGNVIDPLDIVDGIGLDALLAKRTTGLMQPQMRPAIERATRTQFPQGIAAFGADALRLSFASLATMSRDLRFELARVEGCRNFCNKLWNAARYVLLNAEGDGGADHGAELEFSVADRWIRSRLAATLARVEAGFADYRLDAVAAALYEFTWHEFCDWYVESTKTVLQAQDAREAQKRGTRYTLVDTLETLLRALHPLAPFISEEIWQRARESAGVAGETIMLAVYPRATDLPSDPQAELEMAWVRQFVLGIRQIRGEMDIAPSRRIDVVLQNAAATDIALLDRNLKYLQRLAGIEVPRVLAPGEPAPIAAVALLGALEILVPMAGLIDPSAERERLAKRQRKAQADLQKLQAKAQNAEFVRNAPADVVAKDAARIAELQTEIGQLQRQAARVHALLAG
ncbi:MAG TPA: valine--tRNA ligase [Steroidobacteraceae bacterium]|nr:valine--tRNA ligase [Steroidobacteraceae bacterium]